MKLSDNQVQDLLTNMARTIKRAEGETTRGETALRTAEKMLGIMQIGLLCAAEGINPDDLKTQPEQPPRSETQ